MLNCYNKGCGQTFDPDNNADDACRHHPGAPFFHDAYKGWSCCQKKSVDFTEFLNIKGCTTSKHSNVKPPEPVKPKKMKDDIEEIQVDEVPPAELRKPVTKSQIVRPPFNSTLIKIVPNVMPALKEAIDSLNISGKSKQALKTTPLEIPFGTPCKNLGCQTTYTSPETDLTTCKYHHGVPIFHEGMKYYSCCNRKTSDFTSFLNQEGCATGQHKWFKEKTDNVINCRYDYHQTSTDVTVAIYAKLYHYDHSYVKVNPIRLCVQLLFPQENDTKFDLDLELRGVIKPELTNVKFYGTKIEIILYKAEQVGWAKLEMPKQLSTGTSAAEPADKPNDESDSDEDLDDLETVGSGTIITDAI